MKHTTYPITVEASVRCLVDYSAGAPVGDGMNFLAGERYRMVRWSGRAGDALEVNVIDDTGWWTSHDIDGAYHLPSSHADVIEVVRTEDGITRRQMRQSERTAR